jgi:hypothetical protein
MMMQTADFRQFPDRPQLGWLNWPRFGCIHVERPMDSPSMIILHVGSKNPAQMSLVQDDDIIETIATNTADEPLDIRRLPRTARCDLHLFDA